MKVKVREKVDAHVIAGCGIRKALFSMQNASGDWIDVSVARYKGDDYFLVEIDGFLKECLPL